MRVAFVVSNERDMLQWRKPLIQALVSRGVEVLVIAPQSEAGKTLGEMGCLRVNWEVKRKSLIPWKELSSIWRLYRICRKHRPDLVHQFTIKPNIYGTICSRLVKIPVSIATVTGLGYFWTEERFHARAIRLLLGPLYRRSLRCVDVAIFLNEQDRQLLRTPNSIVLPGEGVDLHKYSPLAVSDEQIRRLRGSLGLSPDDLVVLMVSRILRHKGVREFVEAAKKVRLKWPACRFLLVGGIDPENPSHIKGFVLKEWERAGLIRYLGERTDVRDLMALADLVVLPSYREGVPAVLMEAAAMGKALVATDVAGCNDVVRNGINGLLVPIKDAGALSAAIGRLLVDPDLRSRFQLASREIAEKQFSSDSALRRVLRIYAEHMHAKGIMSDREFLAWPMGGDGHV